jgi:hypothetical protein
MSEAETLTPGVEAKADGIAPKQPKRGGAYKLPTERHTAAAALMDAGMDPKAAARQLGYSEHYVPRLVQRIKEKGIGEYVTEKRLKSAKHVVDTFMKGKPIGRRVEEQVEIVDGVEVRKTIVLEPGVFPKDSTVKDCAMSVLDRAYPKQSEEKPAGMSFTQVNISLCTINNDPAPMPVNPPAQREAVGNQE